MSLIKALMEGQDLTKEEAKSLILEMRKRIHNDNEDPEEVLYEEGLEPDYVFELIWYYELQKGLQRQEHPEIEKPHVFEGIHV